MNKIDKKTIIILFLLMLSGFLLMYRVVQYNLPVCANVDERQSLYMLHRFETVDLNPTLYNWPAFYFYINFFIMKICGTQIEGNIHNALKLGRLLNLINLMILSVLIFILNFKLFKSKISAIISGAFTVFSPSLFFVAGYICTDIFLAVLSVLSVLCFIMFIERRTFGYWIFAYIFLGLAISAKYTAVIILISYVIYYFFFISNRDWEFKLNHRSFFRLNMGNIFVWGLLAASMVLIFLSAFFPMEYIKNFIAANGLINSKLEQTDIVFLEYARKKALALGVFILIFAVLCFKFKTLRKRISSIHLLSGIAVAALCFLISSPYTLLDWKRFVYMFGSHFKMNAFYSDKMQFGFYLKILLARESIIILLLFIIGMFASISNKKCRYLLVYILVYAIITGSATIGFVRYLAPCLPFVFCFAGYGLFYLVNYFFMRKKGLAVAMGSLILIFIFIELNPKINWVLGKYNENDEMYGSYTKTLEINPKKIFYSRFLFVPTEELRIQNGYIIEEIPRAALATDDLSIYESLQDDDILILHHETQKEMSDFLKGQLVLLWQTNLNYGQYIYAKKTNTFIRERLTNEK